MFNSGLLIFAGSVLGVAAATAITLAVLRPPLRPLLAELCGGRARGDAWSALISICALLGATAASMLPDGALASGDGSQVLLVAAAQGALGLAGVLLSMGITGAALFVYIRRSSACDM